jgi:hypothetical protein
LGEVKTLGWDEATVGTPGSQRHCTNDISTKFELFLILFIMREKREGKKKKRKKSIKERKGKGSSF